VTKGKAAPVTAQTKPSETPPADGAPRIVRLLSRLSVWLRSALFRETSGDRLGWRKILGGAAFIVVGAAVALARTSGPGALNTTWIEDAGNLLNDAINKPVLTTLVTQVNGYYVTAPRVATAIATLFPLTWMPGVMSVLAAAQYGMYGLIAYIASGPHLHSRWLRLLVAAPVVVIPLGYTQANNDLVTVQFFLLYGIFWLVLWRPGTRAGQIAAPIIMLAATLTTILTVLLAPLVVARLIADRSKTAIAVAVGWAAGLVVQWSLQLSGTSTRVVNRYTSPLWSLGQYVTRAIPRAIFGERALGGPGTDFRGSPIPLSIPNMAVHDALIWGACAIVVAVIGIALGRLTSPQWPLAVTALGFSILIFLGEIVDNEQIVQPRYVIAPALLLYTAIVAMLRPRGLAEGSVVSDTVVSDTVVSNTAVGSIAVTARSRLRPVLAWLPVATFAVLLAVVIGFNYRVVNSRSESPPWTAVVAAARQSCREPGVADYVYAHLWYFVSIPCSRV
jgi:hypothetical protein